MVDNKLKINIKLMNSSFTVDIENTATILLLKTKIKETTKAEEVDQKIIFKGCEKCLIFRPHFKG
jgi:hypothetical protein